jgi:hypothetical protein
MNRILIAVSFCITVLAGYFFITPQNNSQIQNNPKAFRPVSQNNNLIENAVSDRCNTKNISRNASNKIKNFSIDVREQNDKVASSIAELDSLFSDPKKFPVYQSEDFGFSQKFDQIFDYSNCSKPLSNPSIRQTEVSSDNPDLLQIIGVHSIMLYEKKNSTRKLTVIPIQVLQDTTPQGENECFGEQTESKICLLKKFGIRTDIEFIIQKTISEEKKITNI